MERPIVYLCGGMKSGWQDDVIEARPFGVSYLDPRKHGLQEEEMYTAWDIGGVAMCDIIWCYLEESNPGGHNACFEFGMAAALDKKLVLVCDKRSITRYIGMLRQVAHVYFEDFEDALDWWRTTWWE